MFHGIRRSRVSISHNFSVFLLSHNTVCIEIFDSAMFPTSFPGGNITDESTDHESNIYESACITCVEGTEGGESSSHSSSSTLIYGSSKHGSKHGGWCR